MHYLAACAPTPQATVMIRALSDLGVRLGEMLALERGDVFVAGCDQPSCALKGAHVHIGRTVTNGAVTPGTKTTRGRAKDWRSAPLPPELAGLIRGMRPRLETRLLFPSARGTAWSSQSFYRYVWRPACRAAEMPDARPHELRHSFVSLMRAAGVDPADLAAATGHSVLTATRLYHHSVGTSWEAVREAVD